jgi:phosphatidylinositol glycan class V
MTGGTVLALRHYVLAGIVISNVCHLLSVVVLFRLLTVILGPQQQSQVPFIASVLHVLTPASLFLSAPYAEALFSLLNLTGMLHYALSRATAQGRSPSIQEDAYKLSSGLLFFGATLMRSNGLMSGLILLYDVGRYIPRVVSMQLNMHDIRRIVVTCVAGVLVALGFILPQYLAYADFCHQSPSSLNPSWCKNSVPSIYSWVQRRYW